MSPKQRLAMRQLAAVVQEGLKLASVDDNQLRVVLVSPVTITCLISWNLMRPTMPASPTAVWPPPAPTLSEPARNGNNGTVYPCPYPHPCSYCNCHSDLHLHPNSYPYNHSGQGAKPGAGAPGYGKTVSQVATLARTTCKRRLRRRGNRCDTKCN